ncbi:MAG: quinohemoprotein amine dehydrogenase subunit alpha [Terriglobia bacterium]|nr:MAG: quinohemoprotein amine dehydrogenase subunit alpha [Terriglobia bacterium]
MKEIRMGMTHSLLRAGVISAISIACIPAQEAVSGPGIPIDHPLTIAKCGGCHQRDANGMMRRMSYIRTSPEVWEQIIKRMVRLNGLVIKPEEAREILRYLSANNGLAPEEAKPVFWEAEHRLFRDQSDKIPSDALQHTCNYCHTIGRVLTQRRTHDDYEKLIAMHLGMFPGAENTLRPRRPSGTTAEMPVAMISPTGGNPAVVPAPSPVVPVRSDGRYPADVAIDYLAKEQPLITPEWTAWKAVMRTPKLEGKWLMTGYEQGKGRMFGTVTVEAGASPGEFTTKTEIEYAGTGATLSRSGKGIVYTGYSWRGRSTGPKNETPSADPGVSPSEWREALFVSRDGNTMDGRWFWGGYEEFGFDVHLTRIGTQPLLAGANLFSLQSPSTSEVKLYGANFPADLQPGDFDFGTGIAVKRIVRRAPSMAVVEVEVNANLPTGIRDIAVRRATAERAIAVYDKIAYIKVLPDASMARLGGTIAAKQYAQFEAIAYAAGADGKNQTADDVPLGPVTAHWGMEEFVSTPDDDDIKYVGSINDSGLFTPNIEGPNPQRKKQSNNYPTNNWGDVWVTASYDPPGGGAPMRARSYLVVTIPVYIKYDQPEVAQ